MVNAPCAWEWKLLYSAQSMVKSSSAGGASDDPGRKSTLKNGKTVAARLCAASPMGGSVLGALWPKAIQDSLDQVDSVGVIDGPPRHLAFSQNVVDGGSDLDD